MEAFPDYYGILGVPRYTKWDGIRRAYLRKARQHHPDLHPYDPEAGSRMSAINGAYATLSDPARRAQYDALRTRVVVHPNQVHLAPDVISGSGHLSRTPEEPGILSTALSLLKRIYYYVAA